MRTNLTHPSPSAQSRRQPAEWEQRLRTARLETRGLARPARGATNAGETEGISLAGTLSPRTSGRPEGPGPLASNAFLSLAPILANP
jgi:hypothetical protein